MQLMKACQAIRQLGHEVQLFVPGYRQPKEKADLSTFYGLHTEFNIEWLASNRRLHRYDLAFQAVRRAMRLNADATYVWPIQAGIFSLLAKLPVLIELHGPPEGRFGPVLFRLFQRLPGKKRLLPITHALANQLQIRFGTGQRLMQVSPNGVDLERYANLPDPSTARQNLGLPLATTAGYTGHLYPGRGMGLLVELARRFPATNFLWVGGQPADVSHWHDRLMTENISNIILTGFVENERLPLYQAAADILLMPYEKVITGSSGGDSTSYASPMKMFEYMASRRAIISSDLPVIREVLNPSNAMLCPAEDVESWSQALADLLGEPVQRRALAQQAWSDVQPYTWQERARRALAGFVV
jgi:glycosyltransferase involved in cell wall biosynthesis